jgi:hypothetical protein
MLAALTAVAIGMGPAERDYRLTIHDAPRGAIALRTRIPNGWIAAFCTPRVCAPGHVVVNIPPSGQAVIDLHVYRVDSAAAHHANVSVSAPGAQLSLPVDI